VGLGLTPLFSIAIVWLLAFRVYAFSRKHLGKSWVESRPLGGSFFLLVILRQHPIVSSSTFIPIKI